MIRKTLIAIGLLVALFAALFTCDFTLALLPLPWWLNMILTATANLTVCLWLPRRLMRRRQTRVLPHIEPQRIWVDPREPAVVLDPHGDGTVRPGDPVFDNVLLPLIRGDYKNGAIMIRHDGGLFEVFEPCEKTND